MKGDGTVVGESQGAGTSHFVSGYVSTDYFVINSELHFLRL